MSSIVVKTSSLLERLSQRFFFSGSGKSLNLSTLIVPTTDADKALMVVKHTAGTVAISSTGYKAVITVPKGQRYHVKAFQAFVDSGTWTMTNFQVGPDNTGTYHCGVQFNSSGTLPNPWTPYQDFILEAGWTIYVYVNTYTGAGNLGYRLIYELEELRS